MFVNVGISAAELRKCVCRV